MLQDKNAYNLPLYISLFICHLSGRTVESPPWHIEKSWTLGSFQEGVETAEKID